MERDKKLPKKELISKSKTVLDKLMNAVRRRRRRRRRKKKRMMKMVMIIKVLTTFIHQMDGKKSTATFIAVPADFDK